ncbi:MAG: hypothetical protein SGI72_00600 [Planctomycetota bacterium]|nr:hypothetical protein [Planctomycetota bacterium]
MRFFLALAACGAVAFTPSVTVAQTTPKLEHRFEGLVTDAFLVNPGSGLTGAVFSSTLSGGTFSTFTAITGPSGTGPCSIGDALGWAPLDSIAVATNGDLWVGGECGRVWRRSSSTWTEVKSQTDGHIVDLASAPGGYVYGTSSRMNLTGPGLVRWKP